MTTTAPSAPPPVDAANDPHLSGVFEPVIDEIDAGDLEVTGELPPEMDGMYLRNGPNPRFTPLGSYIYPLEGDGMVHGLWVSGGKARYSNRFVHTPMLDAEITAGRALWGGIMSGYSPGADVVGPSLAGTMRDLPDINVVRHGGKLLALAESSPPYALTPELATVGKETFGGSLPAGLCAHPKVDPRTGEMVVFCYGLEAPYLTWAVLGPDGGTRRAPTAVTGVDQPVMIHDMALTERFVVLVLGPMYFDMAAAMRGGSLLAWRPEDGTRIALIPRDGSPVRWAHTEAFWSWHSANAYDADDGGVVLDFVEWSRPGGLSRGGPIVGGIARAEIDPVGGTITRRFLTDPHGMEFPRVDDRRIGHEHGVVALGTKTGRAELANGEFDAVLWLDPATGRTETWEAGDLSVGEPCFVPRPGDTDSSHGWWVTFATDRTDRSSWFVVFAAADPAAGPVARVRIPVRVPLGLHGAWLPTEE
ncbi:carotenoid cleavage dioxygenase [Actinomycetospora succinea]|uniref:Dioxygenase n=1 Tax=Actinomycetospora succinea TaxID=663603 RepID=A0A4R6VGU5_9PSEU|nr:carotenoid oxygenase family protein [Actinomycetospora succinea]TDQ62427.1 carotenoid cleavage dioxygenase [Actinomycetospora succinea]